MSHHNTTYNVQSEEHTDHLWNFRDRMSTKKQLCMQTVESAKKLLHYSVALL